MEPVQKTSSVVTSEKPVYEPEKNTASFTASQPVEAPCTKVATQPVEAPGAKLVAHPKATGASVKEEQATRPVEQSLTGKTLLPVTATGVWHSDVNITVRKLPSWCLGGGPAVGPGLLRKKIWTRN